VPDAPRRMRNQNIVVYKTDSKEVVFSPLEDTDFIKEMLDEKDDALEKEIINIG